MVNSREIVLEAVIYVAMKTIKDEQTGFTLHNTVD